MRSLQVENGDIVRLNGRAVVIDGKDAMKQRIRHRLDLMLGEWSFGVSDGLDWLTVLQEKNDNGILKSEIKRVLEKDSEIIRISEINIEVVDRSARSYRLSFTANSVYGKIQIGVST